jgi:predicted DNA-binding protein
LGRTETIKKRAVYVYLPSIEQKERWENYAKECGTSVSKFVVEHVENSLRQEEDPSYKSRGELFREVREFKEQFDKVTREKRVLNIALERLEAELRRYRAQPFLEGNFVGIRRYQKELIDTLKNSIVISSDDILSRLGIDFSEHEAVRSISKQLENLEIYGLVRSTPRGWKWVK